MSTFCKRSYHRKCQRRGVGGQKKQNFVNVVCEQPLILSYSAEKLQFQTILSPYKLNVTEKRTYRIVSSSNARD